MEHSVEVPDFVEAPLAIEAPVITHESGGVEEEDKSGVVEEEGDRSWGVEEGGISERSGEVEEGIPPSFEIDYEAERSRGDEDVKDEDDILEDVDVGT
ncbi:hypothetical protein V6N12_042458 [Hibiscus sabdariffa]|uniref:Uncharacterized protein n=1 Tax=Hibiscus sabdariffa TaxID=183260 RepID=A0ABR2EEU0_9ROSI